MIQFQDTIVSPQDIHYHLLIILCEKAHILANQNKDDFSQKTGF
jgi:hypothetical protein